MNLISNNFEEVLIQISWNCSQEKPNYKTLKKTRKFVLDGKIVTLTTSKVVREGSEDKSKQMHENRCVISWLDGPWKGKFKQLHEKGYQILW